MTSRPTDRVIALFLTLVLVLSMTPALEAQTPPPAGPEASLADGVWPREIDANGTAVLVYQPQIDKWENNRLEARAAVSVRPPGAPQPSYGVIWLTARTEVDKARGLVSLEDIKIPKVNFPGSPPKAQEQYLRGARLHLPSGVRTVPLEQFEANLAVAQAGTKTAGMPVQNDPPRIIMSAVPALLVRIDGAPTMRQVQGSSLLRVINTPALILLDPSTGRYYLYTGGRWMEAAAVDGPWAPAANPPASLEDAKRAAVAAGPVDLLDPAPGQAPPSAIYVSNVPTELIETSGPPTWSPIPGTELLYATNTKAHLFLELKTQYTYVLISGRWFRTRSTDGPWEYVPGGQLPPDFAKIPERSPSGVVLASVPGTQQAQEAVIANSIPQTATVNRSAAHFTATYDGPPQWRPIAGAPLQYAVNSPMPIIRVDAKTYYALYNAVWFVATTPSGPWVVATLVPAVIYTIPVTSPLHYVTYVRVYSATPAVVYVGYTPGYLGTVVAPDGVVVYGTGVVYTPWVGTVWYPPPPTYGYGAGFAWGATTGFMMGAVTGAAMWGCCGSSSSSTTNINVNKTVTNVNTNSSSNVYNNWSKTTVSSGSKSATVYQGPDTKVATNNQNNNVYASHDGNAYKKQDGQWEKWGGSGTGWQPVQAPSQSTSTQKTSSTSSSPTPSSSSSQSLGAQQSGSQGSQQRSTQQPGAQQPSSSQASQEQRAGQQGAQQPGAQERAGQRQAGQQRSSQELGSSREGGAGQSGSRFGGSQGQSQGLSQRFGSRFSGGGGGTQGLEGESASRDRGFERFSGSRGGGFRR